MNDYLIVLFATFAVLAAVALPGIVRDVRDAKAARAIENTPEPEPEPEPIPDLPLYPVCARSGCSKVWDQTTGQFVCGTCGRPLAITREHAS